jgi:hypothetical protein
MRNAFVALLIAVLPLTTAHAKIDVSVGVELPGVRIGVNVPAYPNLVQVPGYPVYYDSQSTSNYFFYDGLYWVYAGDNWYASSWYNGPWRLEPPEDVPLFVLRVPVRYYREAPGYFRGWRTDDPPRWGEHWGHAWEEHRPEWKTWNRPPAPLPEYQRKYVGQSYPQNVEERHSIRSKNYKGYQPYEPVTQRHFAKPQQENREKKKESRGEEHR